MADMAENLRSRAYRQELRETVEETTGWLRFLYKHKHKLAIGGAVVVAGAAAYAYFHQQAKRDADEEGAGDGGGDHTHGVAVAAGPHGRPGARELSKPGQRSRMLLRIRKQFDLAIKQFLPTMRLKVRPRGPVA
jgi:hypothetical protein